MWNGYTWSGLGRSSNGVNGTVFSIEISGTNVYVGGSQTIVSDNVQNITTFFISKWNGTWSALGTNQYIENGANNVIRTMDISGSNIYVAGDFTQVSDLTQNNAANRIAIWNSKWSSLGISIQNGTNNDVHSIELDNYNNVYVGGKFTVVTDSTQNVYTDNSAIWNGSKWNKIINESFNKQNKIVNVIKISDTNIYVGGFFTQVTDSLKSIFVNNIFKLR
jgi:hypothetical protein